MMVFLPVSLILFLFEIQTVNRGLNGMSSKGLIRFLLLLLFC